MRMLFVLLIWLLSSCQAQRALTPFSEGETELWGFKDAAGNVVIGPNFQHAYEFNGRLAAVLSDSGWIFIDRRGAVQTFRPFLFDNGPDYYVDGMCRFVLDGKIGFLDDQGRIAVAPMAYDFVNSFSEGYAVVCAGCKRDTEDEHGALFGGKWGFVDKQGRVVIPLEYELAQPFTNGKARVMREGVWLWIDAKGKVVR